MSYSTTGTPVSNNVLGRLQLLFVNSDPLTRELYTHALNLEGYNVERAGDGPDALQWFEMEGFPPAHQNSSLEQNGLNQPSKSPDI
jgi:CheY-like chemotaxis protein